MEYAPQTLNMEYAPQTLHGKPYSKLTHLVPLFDMVKGTLLAVKGHVPFTTANYVPFTHIHLNSITYPLPIFTHQLPLVYLLPLFDMVKGTKP